MSDTNTTRQDGFYWIRIGEDFDWEIAFFLQRFGWQRTGCRNANVDHDFTEIDERRIVREEPRDIIPAVPVSKLRSLGEGTKN